MKSLKITSLLFITSVTSFALLGNSPKAKIKQNISNAGSDVRMQLHYTPSDPYYTGESKVLAGVYSNPTYVYQNIALKNSMIASEEGGLQEIWESYTGNGVKVAVIDSGIDVNHPDFATQNKIDPNSAYIGHENYNYINHTFSGNIITTVGVSEANLGHRWEWLNTDKEPLEEKVFGYNAHGTNVASTILAADNEVGTVGVAPNATLLAIRSDLTTIAIATAIRYAVDQGAKVINLSLGTPSQQSDVTNAINYAYEHNVIVIASAGNYGNDTKMYPACDNHVIGVGALTIQNNYQRIDFSNYNKISSGPEENNNVDVLAPGFVVCSDYSGEEGNGQSTYVQTQGTSFSAPLVAGAAALWLEKHPSGTPDDFESALKATTRDLYTQYNVEGSKWDYQSGFGALDVYALVNYGEPTFSLSPHHATIIKGHTLKLNVNPDDPSASISFTSSDENIATVSEEGIVTAKEVGEVDIIVKVGNTTKICTIKIIGSLFGCGGNVITTSTLLTMLSISLIPIVIISKKKKKRAL